MGGYGSGRSGGRPTVEDSLSLNLSRLFKTGWLKQGAWISGTIVGSGEETASIGFEARLGEKDGYVRLHWTSTNRWSGEKRQCENRIELTTRAQPLGGRRWWFVCPRTGQLAERLHLPSGADTFACRKAYRLADHNVKRRVIAPYRVPSRFATNSATMAGSAITLQSPRACTGALSNAPWEKLTGRRASSTGTPFSCSIASTGPLPDSKQSKWHRSTPLALMGPAG